MTQKPAARTHLSPGDPPGSPRAFSAHWLFVKADRRPRPWRAGSTPFNCGGFTAFLRLGVSLQPGRGLVSRKKCDCHH